MTSKVLPRHGLVVCRPPNSMIGALRPVFGSSARKSLNLRKDQSAILLAVSPTVLNGFEAALLTGGADVC